MITFVIWCVIVIIAFIVGLVIGANLDPSPAPYPLSYWPPYLIGGVDIGFDTKDIKFAPSNDLRDHLGKAASDYMREYKCEFREKDIMREIRDYIATINLPQEEISKRNENDIRQLYVNQCNIVQRLQKVEQYINEQ